AKGPAELAEAGAGCFGTTTEVGGGEAEVLSGRAVLRTGEPLAAMEVFQFHFLDPLSLEARWKIPGKEERLARQVVVFIAGQLHRSLRLQNTHQFAGGADTFTPTPHRSHIDMNKVQGTVIAHASQLESQEEVAQCFFTDLIQVDVQCLALGVQADRA